MRIQLASTSPRRVELLRAVGLTFSSVPPGDEIVGVGPPSDRAMQRAEAKARGARFDATADSIVLGVDTVVALGDREFGKARDHREAAAVLRALAGHEHEVFTGHYAFRADEPARAAKHLARAAVRMDVLDDAALAAIVMREDWIGKAGAYGIQDLGTDFVHLCAGDRDTVIGMSVVAVAALLEELR